MSLSKPRQSVNQVFIPTAKKGESKVITTRDHILQAPDNYVGSTKPQMMGCYVFDPESDSVIYTAVFTCEAIEKTVCEIQENAMDAISRSRMNGNPNIKFVEFNNFNYEGKTMLQVINYGDSFKIEWTMNDVTKEKQLVPIMLFQEERSSTNYSNNRVGVIGKNGIGAKATVTLSQLFLLHILDTINHLQLRARWINNKDPRYLNQYQVDSYDGTEAMTSVSWVPDLMKFGLDKLSNDLLGVLQFQMIKLSYANKIPVSINGKLFDYSDVTKFANLVLKSSEKPDFIYYRYPAGTTKKQLDDTWRRDVEILARFTPNKGKTFSFVNGHFTPDNGTHVDEVVRSLYGKLMDSLNEDIEKDIKREIIQKRREEGKDNTKGRITNEMLEKVSIPKAKAQSRLLTIKDVMRHVSLVVSMTIEGPDFESQMKRRLTNQVSEIKLNTKEEKELDKWPLKEILKKELSSKNSVVGLNFGKKRLSKKKYEDANYAGRRPGCRAYAVEGDSARAYVRKFIDLDSKGKDYSGILTCKGKFLNVLTATIKQLEDNVEFRSLIEMLGLRTDIPLDEMDEYYAKPENFKTLRYDEFVIVTDSDVDGLHIRGLLILAFWRYWRSLLNIGYVKVLLTPILRVKVGRTTYKFFTDNDHDKWKQEYIKRWEEGKESVNPDSFKYVYYKGLGSSDDNDIKDDHENEKYIRYVKDPETEEYLLLAFDESLADERKAWVAQPVNVNEIEDYTKHINDRTIKDFVNEELVLYAKDNNKRSLKKLADGLTEAQRKLVWNAFKFWNVNSDKKNYESDKLDPFVNDTVKKMGYQHGAQSLTTTAEGMCQFFTGKNNLQLFDDVGQFGSRYEMGKDCSAARYLKLRPSKVFPKMFRHEDNIVIHPMIEENKEIEPSQLAPLIPLLLVNGSDQLGSGWSSKIPMYNPLELINLYYHVLTTGISFERLPTVEPWYFGYNGHIETTERGQVKKYVEGEDAAFEDGYSLVFTGVYETSGDNVIISELPVGVSAKKYREKFLDKLQEDKIIKRYDDKSTVDSPKFILYGYKKNPDLKNLRLTKSISLNNFVYLDNFSNPRRSKGYLPILKEHFYYRLDMYRLRKEAELRKILEKLEREERKIRIIETVRQGSDKIRFRTGISREAQRQAIEALGVEYDLFKGISSDSYNDDGYREHLEDLQKLRNQYDAILKKDVKQVWLEELKELYDVIVDQYKARYKKIEDAKNAKKDK